MTSKELQEKLTKAQEKLTKKEALLKKYEAKVEKIKAQIIANGWTIEGGRYQKHTNGACLTEEADKCYWMFCDLDSAEEGVENTTKAIAEQKNIVAKWEASLAKAKAQESIYTFEYPEIFKEYKQHLTDVWTKQDIQKRAILKSMYEELGYKEFVKKYKYAGYEMLHTSNDEFRKANERAADNLIRNLWNRVKEKTGTPTKYDLYLENGNSYEGIAINGYVRGTEGLAKVESILAGGYNIQKLHIRVLVK